MQGIPIINWERGQGWQRASRPPEVRAYQAPNFCARRSFSPRFTTATRRDALRAQPARLPRSPLTYHAREEENRGKAVGEDSEIWPAAAAALTKPHMPRLPFACLPDLASREEVDAVFKTSNDSVPDFTWKLTIDEFDDISNTWFRRHLQHMV